MKKGIFRATLGICALFALLIPSVSHAAIYSAKDSYTLPEEETAEGNVYVGGQTITVNGTVTGDFIAGGNTITLNGTLEDDVIVAAGTVTITGTLNDDLRIAAGEVVVSGTVAGDVNVASGKLTLDADAVVGGDVTVAAGTVDIAGTIRGNLGIGSGMVTLSGTVEKNVEAQAESIILTDTAVIKGDFTYTSEQEATISSSAVIEGQTNFTEHVVTKTGRYFGVLGLSVAAFFFNLLSSIIIVLLLVFFVKPLTRKVWELASRDFWMSLVIGLLTLIVVPVLSFLLMLTVVGIPLGIIFLSVYVMLLVFAALYAGILAGSYIMKWIKKDEGTVNWQTAVIGVIVLNAVMLVPVIGWIIGLVFFLASLGSLSKALQQLLAHK